MNYTKCDVCDQELGDTNTITVEYYRIVPVPHHPELSNVTSSQQGAKIRDVCIVCFSKNFNKKEVENE